MATVVKVGIVSSSSIETWQHQLHGITQADQEHPIFKCTESYTYYLEG